MKTLEIKVVVALVVGAAVCGILNNLRVADGRKVTWFGGQQVLATPAEAQP